MASGLSTQVPRPRVTAYNQLTVVPVFPDRGEAGPPEGSPGEYDVTFTLGVPGVSEVVRRLDLDPARAGGDSLLEGSELDVRLGPDETGTEHVARITPNAQGRLAQVQLTVRGSDFADGERVAHDVVMPLLSGWAYEADVAIGITGTLLRESATQIRRGGALMVGQVRQAPQNWVPPSSPELRTFLSVYREGLNASSSFYQALSFFKVVEGVSTFDRKRSREAQRQGGENGKEILNRKAIPHSLGDFEDPSEWERKMFQPYLGKTFEEVKTSVEDAIRNAIAHLTPGREIRVADYFQDVGKCRDAVPVLRYLARELIAEELLRTSSPT